MNAMNSEEPHLIDELLNNLKSYQALADLKQQIIRQLKPYPSAVSYSVAINSWMLVFSLLAVFLASLFVIHYYFSFEAVIGLFSRLRLDHTISYVLDFPLFVKALFPAVLFLFLADRFLLYPIFKSYLAEKTENI